MKENKSKRSESIQSLWEKILEHPDYLTGNFWGKDQALEILIESLESDKINYNKKKIINWIELNEKELIEEIDKIIFSYERYSNPKYDVIIEKYYKDHNLN